jgi:antitoxin component HigA of HigAB toxin-antitoxin module
LIEVLLDVAAETFFKKLSAKTKSRANYTKAPEDLKTFTLPTGGCRSYRTALEVAAPQDLLRKRIQRGSKRYFTVIVNLIAAYEETKRSLKDPKTRASLEAFEASSQKIGLTAVDLSLVPRTGRTPGAKILRGERNLTAPHLWILAERFKVSPALFI